MKKITALLAASFAFAAAASEGVTFNTPVTYTQPVTYAAGVTYLAPVTYAGPVNNEASRIAPVELEGIVVTPSRSYTASEWRAKMQARAAGGNRVAHARHPQNRSDWASVMKSLIPGFN